MTLTLNLNPNPNQACDPEGAYVRKWLPQLALLPVEYIHCPWEACWLGSGLGL